MVSIRVAEDGEWLGQNTQESIAWIQAWYSGE